MEHVGAHECENRHDVVKHRIGCQPRQTRHEKECLVECLWVFRDLGGNVSVSTKKIRKVDRTSDNLDKYV